MSGEEIKPGYKRTEVGVIPGEWIVKKLSELGAFSKGQGIRKNETTNGRLPCIRYGEIYTFHNDIIRSYNSFISASVATSSKRLQNGDILFAASGETKEDIGKAIAFVGSDEVYAGGDIVVLTPKLGHPEFLGYLLNSPIVVRQKSSKGQGDAVVHISANALGLVAIPFPLIGEQRAIATALSDVDALLNKLDQLIAKKRDLKQATMQQLLTGQTRLPGFSEEWGVKRLGDVADLYQPITISAAVFTKDGFPVYGANGVVGYYEDFNHEESQVTVTCRGSTCGTVNKTAGKSWITGNAMVVNCDKSDSIEKEFLYQLLMNQNLTVCITGSGQPQIVRGPLANFEISIPFDRKEQTAIATILSDMDAELATLESRRDKTRALKQGIMQELLTGRTRLV